jgi:hypothetical protein
MLTYPFCMTEANNHAVAGSDFVQAPQPEPQRAYSHQPTAKILPLRHWGKMEEGMFLDSTVLPPTRSPDTLPLVPRGRLQSLKPVDRRLQTPIFWQVLAAMRRGGFVCSAKYPQLLRSPFTECVCNLYSSNITLASPSMTSHVVFWLA